MNNGFTLLGITGVKRALFCTALLSAGITSAVAAQSPASAGASPAVQQVMQQQTVTGTVTDNSGEPLIGVSVVERGTGNGTITDFDGKYSLTVSGPDAVLEFTYVGYTTTTAKVGTRHQA